MAHENILLNDGSDLLLNDGSSVVLLNLETAGIHIAGIHPVADLRGITKKKKRRSVQTVIEAVGQISKVISFNGTAKLFKKHTLHSESKISRTTESVMIGRIWRPNTLWMESMVFSNDRIKLPISDIEKEMEEKMKKAKLKKMMKEYRKEFE